MYAARARQRVSKISADNCELEDAHKMTPLAWLISNILANIQFQVLKKNIKFLSCKIWTGKEVE